MTQGLKIREVDCKTAIGKCGFPGGGWAINPYVGCAHGCVYCYARFMKRFTGHTEKWGTFIDAKINLAEVLAKQLESPKYNHGQIYIGTVTDPYQPIEKKYQLVRSILKVLHHRRKPVSILTKSDLVLRDIDLLKQFTKVDINLTINTLDKQWQRLAEPNSPTAEQRLQAIKKLVSQGITVGVMMGPYWPIFTNPEKLFEKFKQAGVSHVFTESFNTTGSNWIGVEKILKQDYPQLLLTMRQILFGRKQFFEFYSQAGNKIRQLAKKYHLPVTIRFGPGHSG